jgi:hypothetical protein
MVEVLSVSRLMFKKVTPTTVLPSKIGVLSNMDLVLEPLGVTTS